MSKLRDVVVHDRRPLPVECAACGRPFTGRGYFCSESCDANERDSRVVDRLVTGLRAMHGVQA